MNKVDEVIEQLLDAISRCSRVPDSSLPEDFDWSAHAVGFSEGFRSGANYAIALLMLTKEVAA